MGRKKIEIDWGKVDAWLAAGCTGTECAAGLGIHPDTLYNACEIAHKTHFSAYSAERKEKGHLLLRHTRFKKAIQEQDNTLIIFLSKVMLGESDKIEIKDTTEKDVTITVEIVMPESNPETNED